MADKEAKPGSKTQRGKAGQRLTRTERRFAPARGGSAVWTMTGTVVGGLAVGAGVYGRWLAQDPMPYAWLGLAAGAAVLAAVVMWGDLVGQVVRVGDAGVGLERADKPPRRIAWCEVTRVELRDGMVRVHGEGCELSVSVKENPKAAAWAVREAEARVPKVV
ncbi:MAG: hypothetical protein MUF54_10805, partial [Polyangiaceae bacterium]|nr:hypothetical protein [Polyangiaceae bacterium]